MPNVAPRVLRHDEALYRPLDPESDGVKRLMCHLEESHRHALGVYDEYYDNLKQLRLAIAAKPSQKVKTFPWPGASNFVVPLIPIAGDAIKARLVNDILAPKPFWTVRTIPGSQFEDFAIPWQNFLEWAVGNDLGIEDVIDAVLDQTVYLGKCPMKIHWEQDIRKVQGYDPVNGKITSTVRTFADNPLIEPILLENWLEPWGIGDPLRKEWLTQRTFYRCGELKQLRKQGVLPYDRDYEQFVTIPVPGEFEAYTAERKRAWFDVRIVPVYETSIYFDIDEDGYEESLIVKWCLDHAVKPLSVKYNFFWHGKRPFRCCYYARASDDRSAAEGVAHQLFDLQAALSTFVNQRTDNITIANTKVWFAKRNVFKKGEQVYPGMVKVTSDPKNDAIPVDMGTVSPQMFQHESVLRDYAERRSKISDPQLGREFNNPRVAATTTLSILQEGNKWFDMVVRSIRAEFAEIGVMVSQLYQQFGPRAMPEEAVGAEDAMYVRAVLNAGPSDVERFFQLHVNPSSLRNNRETMRQTLQQAEQVTQQYYANVIQVSMQVLPNPQVPQELKDLVIAIAQSSYRMTLETLRLMEITNADDIFLDPTPMMEALRDGTVEPDTQRAVMDAMAARRGLEMGGGQGVGGTNGVTPAPVGGANGPTGGIGGSEPAPPIAGAVGGGV